MPEPRWTEISALETAIELDPQTFCSIYRGPDESPIDSVYSYIQSTIVLGPQTALDDNPALGRLLLLGFVSSVDNYFRQILGGLINICPMARARVSEKPIAFGALDYYEAKDTGLALFENVSFASLKDLRSQTENVAGLRIDSASVIAAARNYEKLCHMRHAATHAGGALNTRNARELGMSSSAAPHHVLLTELQLQTAASVCFSVVRAYNRWLYRGLIEQWIGHQLLTATWQTDVGLIGPLFELFRSQEDAVAPRTAYNAFASMRPAIVAAAASRN